MGDAGEREAGEVNEPKHLGSQDSRMQGCSLACCLLIPRGMGDGDFKIFGFFITLACTTLFLEQCLGGMGHVDEIYK